MFSDFYNEKVKVMGIKSWEDEQSHRAEALVIMIAADLGEGFRGSLCSHSASHPKADTSIYAFETARQLVGQSS